MCNRSKTQQISAAYDRVARFTGFSIALVPTRVLIVRCWTQYRLQHVCLSRACH